MIEFYFYIEKVHCFAVCMELRCNNEGMKTGAIPGRYNIRGYTDKGDRPR